MKRWVHFSTILGIGVFLLYRATGNKTHKGLDKYKLAYSRPTQVPFPEANPFSASKYELGKTLFFDPRLSKSNMLSCASCHNPGLSWSDGNEKAIGHQHKVLGRRTPTLLNAAWGTTFFWDGRAKSLEEQAFGPISGRGEMNMDLALLPHKIAAISGYPELFGQAFGDPDITMERVTKAIATFERTLISEESPFDRWIQGDETAVSKAAMHGFLIFNNKANCVTCHSGWRFTNDSFADIGLISKDPGRGAVKGESKLTYFFKTPTLRNISKRGPYMHDGSYKTLSEVVEHYNKGGIAVRKSVKLFLKPLGLTENEKTDLISFLETLAGRDAVVGLPSLPRVIRRGTVWEINQRQLASE